jgi:hypothetical protein
MKSMRQKIEAAAAVIRASGEIIGMSEPWMILPEEMGLLGITEDEWPLLAATYNAYLAFMDIVEPAAIGFDDDTITAERECWPQCYNPDCILSEEDFATLANAWVNIGAAQAAKTYTKMRLRNEGYFS